MKVPYKCLLVVFLFAAINLPAREKVTDPIVVERIAENSSIYINAFYRDKGAGGISFTVTFRSEEKRDLEIIDILASIHSSDFSIGRLVAGPDTRIRSGQIISSYDFTLPTDLVLRTKLTIDLIRERDPFSDKNDTFVVYLGEAIDWKKIVELSIKRVDNENLAPVKGANVGNDGIRP